MRADHAHIVRAMRDPAPPPRMAEPAEPGARRSLRALLRAGPAAREIARADLWLYRAIRSAARPPALGVVSRFSQCGEHAACWLVVGAIGMAADRPRRAALAPRGDRPSRRRTLLNTAIKGVFRRARPALEDLPALIATPTALSFPSAHASSSFAAARAYSALLPAGPLYATATAMAVSRVYLGVHYPTDIAAGALLGTIAGSAGR